MRIKIVHALNRTSATSRILTEKEYTILYNVVRSVLDGNHNYCVEIPSEGIGCILLSAKVLRESFIEFINPGS